MIPLLKPCQGVQGAEFLSSETYIHSRRRLFKQLIQALLYEKTLNFQERTLSDHGVEFTIQGKTLAGGPVSYHCKGRRRTSFGRIELTTDPVLRLCAGEISEIGSVRRLLTEVTPSFTIAVEFLDRFIQELEHTLVNDAAALFHVKEHYEASVKVGEQALLRSMVYDDIESGLLKAHPYHPCYKSRIGFDVLDNVQYSPEFLPEIKLVWLAVKKANCLSIASPSLHEMEFYRQQLGEQLNLFNELLIDQGCIPSDYLFLPIHPWQWLNQLLPLYSADLHQQNIVFLGEGLDIYRPQQSLRTLANHTYPEKHYVKLALSIVNTSTSRGLAEHTIANAPIISDWLYRLVAEDPYLAINLRPIILREVKAISFSASAEKLASGKIACVWRESLHSYLEHDEQAVPFSGLTEIDRDGKPIIADWISRYGIQEWLVAFIRVSVLPLIRLLYAHGVALESHAQNMILLHKYGRPVRVALKDFHDGVRFIPDLVTHGECLNALWETPQQHLATNSSSYISAHEPEDVKNFLYSAFFSMNLSEVALFFDLHFKVSEARFWDLLSDCIMGYQNEFPDQQQQFQLFNLQSEHVVVEAHTKRRLQNESSIRINRVNNPLFSRSSSFTELPIEEVLSHE